MPMPQHVKKPNAQHQRTEIVECPGPLHSIEAIGAHGREHVPSVRLRFVSWP
jgi:hypothetical protein